MLTNSWDTCRGEGQAVAAKKTALINPSDQRGFFVQL
jgi:hypothetical protein